jgi:hypothetical protein
MYSRCVGIHVGIQTPRLITGAFCILSIRLIYGQRREPTSGLEPLTCSLRVCGQWLLGVARICKSRIANGFSVPSIAHYCRVLHPG